MKNCKDCNNTFDLNAFYFSKGYYESYCKVCSNERRKNLHKKVYKKKLNAYEKMDKDILRAISRAIYEGTKLKDIALKYDLNYNTLVTNKYKGRIKEYDIDDMWVDINALNKVPFFFPR